jgi:hypothetical protein
MRYRRFFGWVFFLLCHTIPFCGNFPGQLSSEYAYQVVTQLQGNKIGALPFSDPFFENYPRLKEYDDGRGPSQLLSHADFRPSRLLILPTLTLILRRQLLITPALDIRAIIFPFHSFL